MSAPSITEILALADAIGDATCLPDHIKSRGDAVALMTAGVELGIGPMAALRGIHLVQGKIGLNADLMAGLLLRADYRLDWLESSATCARLSISHVDGRAPYVEVYDVARAKKAGLWGRGQWSKYPEAMLRARALSAAGRAYAADALAGCYSLDEAREIGGGVQVEEPGEPEHAEPSPPSRLPEAREALVTIGKDAREADDDAGRARIAHRAGAWVASYAAEVVDDDRAERWCSTALARIGELAGVEGMAAWLHDGPPADDTTALEKPSEDDIPW